MSGRLEGKVAIVTGAGSGIGKAAAALFVEQGATVIAADLQGTQITVDAGDEDQVAALVAATVERCGGLDVMFANAGISGGFAGLFEQDAVEWQRILKTNLIGPFVAIKHAAPAIARRGGGSIICTASVAGLRSGAGGPAYSASKAGVINLVQVAAQQLSGSGVRVNAICPGLIETGMTQAIFEAARGAGKEERIGRLNPLRRGGEPREVAQAALFLACAESSYVNGQALIVDGGLSSSHPFTRQNYGKPAL
jgi:NAD(P)-dependent dehydrogenase (short-subunit alcohol dehydrogenase family)